MKKRFLKGMVAAVIAGAGMLAAAGTAQAAVYSYGLTGGEGFTIFGVGTAPNQPNTDGTLKIDTTAGTGSVIGSAINAAFTGDFSTFTGGPAPSGMFNITLSPTSTLSYLGQTYTPDARHQPMLELFGNSINLWAVWTAPGCVNVATLGDTLKNISSSSTGGTSVPEPGMVGLMGLGAAALVVRRRRALRLAAA